MKDGKKRFLFILINFLRTSGWTYKNIEEKVREWNHKNPIPLKETYLVGQLRYAKMNKKIVPPPNYSTQYYRDLGLADPEIVMRKYKNPVMYARVLYEQNKKKSTRLTKEQKEMRRKHRETLKNKKRE